MATKEEVQNRFDKYMEMAHYENENNSLLPSLYS